MIDFAGPGQIETGARRAGAFLPPEDRLGAALVGRQGELAALLSHFDAATAGQTRVVFIAGEAGIGKTRLLDEVTARALAWGAAVLRGNASEAEGMPPYLPFLEALGQHIRTAELEELREQVGVGAAPLAALFPELAVRLGELPLGHLLPPEQARLRLYEAVGELVAAAARARPLVLVLDDLQWVDTASLDLLCHIVRRQPHARLLVLGAYRDGADAPNPPLERAIAELNRLRRLATLALGPLSAAEIGDLARHQLGRPADGALRRLLYGHSEGNPFFAEELLRGWLEAGALDREGFLIDPGSADGLPAGIVAALRVRLTRLSPDVLGTLRAAAIAGRTFTAALLAVGTDQDVETVEAHLFEACRARLIRSDGGETFAFNHDKIRECLYAEVSASRRQRLHGAIGRALEAQPDWENPRYVASLAFHLARSGDRARGAAYSQRAAELALGAYAAAEAVAYYRTAVDLLGSDDRRRGEWLLRLGGAALLAGDAVEAAAAYRAAQAWWLRAGSPVAAARAGHGLGQAQRRLGELASARTSFEAALGLLQERALPEAVRLLVDLATLLGVQLGLHTEGLVLGHRALELARELGDGRLEAAASSALGSVLVRENDVEAGIRLLEQSLALASASDDPLEAARCCARLARASFRLGEIGRSHEFGRRWEELAWRCHDPSLLRDAYAWLAFLHACQGAWQDADRLTAKAAEVFDQPVGVEADAFLHQIRGFVCHHRGDLALAEREFRAALQSYRGADPVNVTLSLGALAAVLLAAGKRQQARDRLAELEALAEAFSAGSMLSAECLSGGTALTCLALAAMTMGDPGRAEGCYARLLAFEGRCCWFLVDRVLALIETQQANWSAAEAHLSQAEATARRGALRPELARTLVARAALERARGGPGSAARARVLLGQALGMFEELGLASELEDTRARLRALPSQPGPITHPAAAAGLSQRELSVLRLVAAGRSNRQIADELCLSEKTVANHLTSIFIKTGASNRAGAAAFAFRQGLA